MQIGKYQQSFPKLLKIDMKSKNKIIIGKVYGQTITGTLFKYEILEYKGIFNNNQYYLVKNIETGHKMLICENELHEIK